MQVWLYRSAGDLLALSVDAKGENLPVEHGPWARVRSVVLNRDDTDERQARSLIGEYGYCCFPADDADDVSANACL